MQIVGKMVHSLFLLGRSPQEHVIGVHRVVDTCQMQTIGCKSCLTGWSFPVLPSKGSGKCSDRNGHLCRQEVGLRFLPHRSLRSWVLGHSSPCEDEHVFFGNQVSSTGAVLYVFLVVFLKTSVKCVFFFFSFTSQISAVFGRVLKAECKVTESIKKQ